MCLCKHAGIFIDSCHAQKAGPDAQRCRISPSHGRRLPPGRVPAKAQHIRGVLAHIGFLKVLTSRRGSCAGDGTVPLLSLGALPARHWRRPRPNQSLYSLIPKSNPNFLTNGFFSR